jgi:predicted nucleotidyltransferase component of viral defense system
LKIEISTREHFTVFGLTAHQLKIANPWFTGAAELKTNQLDELLGTKLRVLYQRRKSRDLFDLSLCLDRHLIDPARVVYCFEHYMKHEALDIPRSVRSEAPWQAK